jgi:hypothetical protein
VARGSVGTPPQRAVGHVTVRTPLNWGRWSKRGGGEFKIKASGTCTLTLSVNAGLTTSRSPSRELNFAINPRNAGQIIKGHTSHAGGVWGVQIYDQPAGFHLLGTTVVKLAPRRMARLYVQLVGAPTCQVTDLVSSYDGPVEHMLRTARFDLRLTAAR